MSFYGTVFIRVKVYEVVYSVPMKLVNVSQDESSDLPFLPVTRNYIKTSRVVSFIEVL